MGPQVGPAEPERLYVDLVLPEGPVERPYVVANMVSTVDGRVRIGTGAGPIGSRLDKTLLRRIRAAADGLIYGAGTLRVEDVRSRLPAALAQARPARGLTPHPRPIAVTRGGDLPLEKRYFADADPPAIVIAPADLPAPARERLRRGGVELVLAGEGDADLAAALRRLRTELGLRHLVLEGGPHLNAAMLRTGLIDEVFWTVAPKLVGGPADLTLVAGSVHAAGEWTNLELLSLHWHASELYLRYRVGRRSERTEG